MGLAIAKDLVKLTGGTIGVRSSPGKGSTFWFTLPFHTPAIAGDPPVVAPPPPTEVGTKLSGHVLLVEDNPVNELVAVEMLKFLGLAVTVARDGCAALAAHGAGKFDLVLMDCQMPEMDGFQATAKVRKWEEERGCPEQRLPIVALTTPMAADRTRWPVGRASIDRLLRSQVTGVLFMFLTRR